MSVATLPAKSVRPAVDLGDRAHRYIDTPLGEMLAVANSTAVLFCDFTDRRGIKAAIEKLPAATPAPAADFVLGQLDDQLAAYFAGRLFEFIVPLAPLGTPFQNAVWRTLLAVPYGQTRSYGKQAAAFGNPKAVRAVAAANGQNFRCILIPCHRVIGADGSLTGYGAGLHRKQWLLDHERRYVDGLPG